MKQKRLLGITAAVALVLVVAAVATQAYASSVHAPPCLMDREGIACQEIVQDETGLTITLKNELDKPLKKVVLTVVPTGCDFESQAVRFDKPITAGETFSATYTCTKGELTSGDVSVLFSTDGPSREVRTGVIN